MSISGDPQTQAGGASGVPAQDVNQQPGTVVTSGDVGAAMSSAEGSDGAGTPDLSALSGLDLTDPAVVQAIREMSGGYYYTRDDVHKSQNTLAERAKQARRNAQQFRGELQSERGLREFLESQLRENLGEDEVQDLLTRYQGQSAQQQQAAQQQAEQVADQWVQTEQSSLQELLMEAAFDGEQQLFNLNDPEIQSATNNYLAAVRAAALIGDEESLDVAHQWRRHTRSLVIRKAREGVRGMAQPQANEPPAQQRATQQRPSRGRQVTSPGGAGGGAASFTDLYNQHKQAGKSDEEAWIQAKAATMVAPPPAS